MWSATWCSVLEVSVTNQWKLNEIKRQTENRYLKDLNRIDGEPMEFEWRIFPTVGIFEEIQKIMIDLQCEFEHFKGKIILMSM